MTSIILDVAVIIGFPFVGVESLTTHDAPIPLLGFHFSKSTTNYASFMVHEYVDSCDVSNV